MIIEFSGFPRSGKTTSLEAVRDYFVRKGYDVKLLQEGARSCPFSHKYRVRTAFWTANQVMNDLIMESINQDNHELVLQDRGVFDAMAFIKLLDLDILSGCDDKRILREVINKDGINNYLSTLANWAHCVDLVLFFKVDSDIALRRDLANQMDAGPGMITNVETLSKLDKAYQWIIDNYGNKFVKIKYVETIDGDPLGTANNAKNDIIQYIK